MRLEPLIWSALHEPGMSLTTAVRVYLCRTIEVWAVRMNHHRRPVSSPDSPADGSGHRKRGQALCDEDLEFDDMTIRSK